MLGVVGCSTALVDLCSVFEKFVKDGLLLVAMDVHPLALNGAVELVLALLVLAIVTRGVSRLHALRGFGCVWQGQQLLLKFS